MKRRLLIASPSSCTGPTLPLTASNPWPGSARPTRPAGSPFQGGAAHLSDGDLRQQISQKRACQGYGLCIGSRLFFETRRRLGGRQSNRVAGRHHTKRTTLCPSKSV